jgi:glycosyltransferase involved in cell wall biosynthesis
MGTFAVDVILRTHNRAALLGGAVESLVAADRTGISVRLLVVDNCSSDGTPELLAALAQRHPDLVVPIREDRPGGQHALNAGLARAEAPVVAFFDDDERVAPDWLQVIAREMVDPATDYIAGPALPLWDEPAPEWLPDGFGGVLGIIDSGPERRAFGPDFAGMLTQGNCALRRSIFDETGPYPANLPTGEDRWLFEWLQARGKRGFYCPDLRIHHLMQRERLSQAYFRQWAAREGRDRATCDRLAGAPSVFGQKWYWRYVGAAAATLFSRRASTAERFKAELELRQARARLATTLFRRGPV